MARSDYTAPLFTDVANPANPPAGAIPLDAAHVNAMAQAIANSVAVGDGPTYVSAPTGGDDTSLLNAALAAGGRVSTRPGRTYRMAGQVTVPAGAALIIAEGATLLATGAGAGVHLSGQGAKLVGPGVIDGGALVDYLMSIDAAQCRVSGATLQNSKTYGIHLTAGGDVAIENNTFASIPSYVLLAETTAVTRPSFRGNVLSNCGQGVDFKDGVTGGVVANNTMQITTSGVGIEVTTSSDFAITGNAITGIPGIAISLAASSGCTVTGNVIRGHSQIGIENTQGSSHNVIASNIVGPSAAGQTGAGIQVTTPSDTTNPQIGVVVTGNIVRNQTNVGILTQRGVAYSILGNTVEDCAGDALSMDTGGHTIVDNTFRHSAPPSGWVAVELFGGPFIFRGNRISVPAGSDGIGIRFAAVTDTQVENNYVINGAYAYAVHNTVRTVLNGNRSTGTTTASVFLWDDGSPTGGATNMILTHIASIASGAIINNTSGAVKAGPVYDPTKSGGTPTVG